MKTERLQAYARLAVRAGVNLQKGQELKLFIGVEQGELAALIVAEAYAAGAAEVSVEWRDERIDRLHYLNVAPERLGRPKDWEIARLERECALLPCQLYINSRDPEALKDVSPALLAAVRRERHLHTKRFKEEMENRYQWAVMAAASPAWAAKVFPDLPESEAVERLWAEIFSACYLEEGKDALALWAERNAQFRRRSAALNAMHLKSLHFRNARGSDLRVGLLDGSLWVAGGETIENGVFCNPNLPTEECFTTPDRGATEGVVYGSKPFALRGLLVEDFWIRFAGGRAVDCGAARGAEALRELIATDEGAAYLGEVALVPDSSPINRSGLLFFETLFDENAASHIALGQAYTANVRAYKDYTRAQLSQMGVNESAVHEDFMIGSADTDVDGVGFDGREYAIFRQGEWAFEV